MAKRRKRRSLKEKLATKKKQSFIGREEQLAMFRVNFDDNFYNIFNIYGQGGVGKTTLSRQYERIAKENKAIVAFIDLESKIKNIPALMAEIVKQLTAQGADFSTFDKKYKTFRQEKEQLEKDPEAPKGILHTIGSTLTKFGLQEAKKIPGGGVVDLIPTDAIASQVGDIATFIRKKITNKDELQLLLEPIEVLTPIFVQEIYECSEYQDVCLIFDTYETAFPNLAEWLQDIYFSTYADVPDNLLLVISGREELDHKWNDFAEIMHKLPLHRFTIAEATAYLNARNITNPTVVETIISISDRLPMLLVLLADKAPETPEQVFDASDSAVERFLKWIDNPEEQEILLAAALPRSLNQDMVEELLKVLDMDETKCRTYYQLLNDQPFVQQRGDIKTYHPVVKDQMLRYQYNRSPKTWAKQHYALAVYFESRAADLGFETLDIQYSNDTWVGFMIEASYHRLCANFEKELPNVVEKMAINLDRTQNKEKLIPWSDIFAKAGKLVKEKEWSDFIVKGISGFIADDEKIALSFFEKIIGQGWIKEPLGTSLFYFQIALLYQEKKFIQLAIENYEKAIQLNPNDATAYYNLGNVYYHKGEITNAIKNYEIAIKLNPNNATAYNNLGIAYKAKEEIENAIKNYEISIQLNPNDATAFYNLGNVYKAKGEIETAIENYEIAIKLDPNYAKAFYNLGIAYYHKGEIVTAIENYEIAIKLNPNYAKAYNFLGWTYLELLKLDNALNFLLKSWQISNYKYGYAAMNIGHVFLLQKNTKKAIEWYKKSIPLWREVTVFFNVMKSDYIDLKMEERGISKATYEEILAQLQETK